MLELKLEWVFGYRGHQCRNNLFVNKNGELVYFVAGLGVVLDVEKRAQKTYDGHSDDILCLSVDKSGTLAATGQIGDDPFLCVWDTLCMQTISILKPFKHGIGISIVAFSMNDDHVFDARFHHTWPQILVTCGLRHVCIWKLCGNVLSPSRIVLEQTVMCLAFGDDAVTLIGALNGSVYLCHKRECVGEVENAHIGGVFCVCQTKETYITGGRDGSIGIWDSKFKRLSSIDLRHKTGISDLWIRSICVYNDNLFVGSHNSDIIMVSLRDRDNIQILVDGHGQGELWALAVHPKRDVFATGGDDRTVRMWSAGDHTLLHTAKLEQWIRSVVFNHDGSMLVCGLADGSVAVLKSKYGLCALENTALTRSVLFFCI
uniref:HELP domain-containing protein n=1 Tax=Plectus sambesii TaxID=2011161 RepID=A0A914X8Q4_9BILA